MRRSMLATAIGAGTLFISSAGAAAQGPGAEGSSSPWTGLTRRGAIERALAEMNDRAAAARPEVAESGERVSVTGPAAWTRRAGGVPRDAVCAVDVALLAADTVADINDVAAKLALEPRISSVTVINTMLVTPTASEIGAFDSVLVWTNSTPLDRVVLGNNLAEYVDAGGGVVLSMFAMRASLEARTLGGRFLSDNYYAIDHSIGSSTQGHATLGTRLIPGSPVLSGVVSFDGGPASFRTPGDLNVAAQRAADWSTGEILAATRSDLPGRRVDLGFWPVSDGVTSNGWVHTTYGARLMANALVYAGGCPNEGIGGCADALTSQRPDPTLDGRNSNTSFNNFSSQQEADDFRLFSGAVRGVVLWGAFLSSGPVPASLRFIVNIHSSVGGDPGPIVFTADAVATAEYSGEVVTGMPLGHRLFRFSIDFDRAFTPIPGATYWLSPLANERDQLWAWQFSSTTGTRCFRLNAAQPWSEVTGGFAFELCGDHCAADFNRDGRVNSQDYFDFLTAFFAGC